MITPFTPEELEEMRRADAEIEREFSRGRPAPKSPALTEQEKTDRVLHRRETRRAYDKAYYQKNKERIKDRYQKNRDKAKTYAKAYCQKNREKINAYYRARYAAKKAKEQT